MAWICSTCATQRHLHRDEKMCYGRDYTINLLIMVLACKNASSIGLKGNSGREQKAYIFVLFSCCMIKMDKMKESAGHSWLFILLIF